MVAALITLCCLKGSQTKSTTMEKLYCRGKNGIIEIRFLKGSSKNYKGLQSQCDDTIKLNFQKYQEAPSRSADTIPQQQLLFHSNSDDTIPQKQRSDNTIIAGSNIPQLDYWMQIILSWTYPLAGYSLTEELMKTNVLLVTSRFSMCRRLIYPLAIYQNSMTASASGYEASDCFVLQPIAVFAWFYGDWLPMLVKDMEILNNGLSCTVQNQITCMNESGYIDDISVPLVLCIVRE